MPAFLHFLSKHSPLRNQYQTQLPKEEIECLEVNSTCLVACNIIVAYLISSVMSWVYICLGCVTVVQHSKTISDPAVHFSYKSCQIEPNTNSKTKITAMNTGMLILHIDTSTTNLHQLLSLTAVVAVLLGANIPYLFTRGVKNSRLGTMTMLA